MTHARPFSSVRAPRALFAAALFLAACPAPKPQLPKPQAPTGEARIQAASLVDDIRQLADPAWEGRGAGTAGIDKASEFLAARFQSLGLKPGGPDGSFFMPFEVNTSAKIGETTDLRDPAGSVWRAPYDFVPLSYSASAKVEAEIVSVGYGLVISEQNRDDYAGLDVKGKIVLVTRGLPAELERDKEAQQKSLVRYKVFAAKDKGAAAVIFVSPPPREGEAADDPLTPLNATGGLGGSGILAVHMRRAIANGWLLKAGISPASPEATKPRALGQRVTLTVELTPTKATVKNVVALVPGSDPALSKEAVVIGAHYDHIGLGGPGSLSPNETGTPHVGADDNASGTSALLAIAAAAATDKKRPARTLVLIAFAGEEMGLLGSAYYVEHPVVPNNKTVAMLNMDMIGRLRDNAVSALGSPTAKEWNSLLDQSAQGLGLSVTKGGSGYGPSDHTSFYVKNIPVLHFFTGAHSDYHKPSDTWDKVNGEGLAQVAKLVYRTARGVSDQAARLTLIATPPPPPGASGGESRGYGAYLGTIPDFTPSAGGVKLSGVKAGSPAEAAGLKAGDLLTHIAGKKIDGLEEMTIVLRALYPGDEIELEFIRDGASQKVKAKLARRP